MSMLYTFASPKRAFMYLTGCQAEYPEQLNTNSNNTKLSYKNVQEIVSLSLSTVAWNWHGCGSRPKHLPS